MNLLIPLFSPAHGSWGGLTRTIAIAEAAKGMGHQVAFCASEYSKCALRRHDYKVYTAPATTMWGLPKPLSRLLEQHAQHISIPVRPGKSIGNIWMLLWMSGYARSGYLHRLVEAYLRAADDFQADRIFTELDPGAFLLSAVSDIPLTLTYSHILTHGNGTWAERLMQRVTTMVLRTYNVHTSSLNDLYFDKMRLKIIPSIPELDDTDPVSPDVQYVGHLIGSIQSAPFGRLQLEDRQRCVFVYVGTGSISLNVLNNVLPQVFPSKSKWRCFVGAQSVTTSYRLGSVEFHPYVPTDILLPQCDWVICHGGQNTIIQSLLHGVPLIIFPGSIFERRYNAAKIEQSGAGIMGEVNRFTVGWLHAALERQRDCASRSDALGKAIRSHGGPFAAVEAIANWNGCHHEQSSRC